MADGGIQMSEAFSHFVFVPLLSEGVHEGPSAPSCDTQSMEHSNKCSSFFLLKSETKKQKTATEELNEH